MNVFFIFCLKCFIFGLMKKQYNCNIMNFMLREIGNTTPLTAKEERDLFLAYDLSSPIQQRNIKGKIIKSNMRFVLDVALRYKYMKNISIPELVTEGKLGLLVAFDKFDRTKNLRFISYAVWWIRSRMGKCIEQCDLIRLPTHRKIKLTEERKFKDVNDFDKDMYYLHELTNMHLSLDDNAKGTMLPISEVIADESVEDPNQSRLENNRKKDILVYLSTILTKEECTVINSLYGIESSNPMTLRDVKDVISKSHERVRQIRDNALKILRKPHHAEQVKNIFSLTDATY